MGDVVGDLKKVDFPAAEARAACWKPCDPCLENSVELGRYLALDEHLGLNASERTNVRRS